jgi:hypothetical protein
MLIYLSACVVVSAVALADTGDDTVASNMSVSGCTASLKIASFGSDVTEVTSAISTAAAGNSASGVLVLAVSLVIASTTTSETDGDAPVVSAAGAGAGAGAVVVVVSGSTMGVSIISTSFFLLSGAASLCDTVTGCASPLAVTPGGVLDVSPSLLLIFFAGCGDVLLC